MKKIIIIIIVICALVCFLIYQRKPNANKKEMKNRIVSKEKNKKVVLKSDIGEKNSNSNLLFSNLMKDLKNEQTKLGISDITNIIVKPYILMKNKTPNDVEKLISLKKGFPEYLSKKEINLREKAFDAYNNLPPEIQYWSSIDKDYSSMTNAVLRKEEIDKVIELNKEDWENLVALADRLLLGIDAYRDIPAARKILEYVWQNCPPDVNLDNEYWKFTGLQFLAQSYIDFSESDNYNKGIELFNLLDKEFTFDYKAGKNDYKNPYFWPGILCQAYSYSMLDDYGKVDDIYNRFDEAFDSMEANQAVLIKESIISKIENGIIMKKYNQGDIGKNELINHFIEAAKKFDKLANSPDTNPYLKQKNLIDKEQALNLVEYLKKNN